jgi:hypothetical protein
MTLLRASMKNVSWLVVGLALLAGAACTRKEAPELQPAAAPPPPPPAAVPSVRDAGADVVDAASDAGDARRGGGKRWIGTPPTGGGGLKVEGSLPRAEGDKVVRGAQGKLRACFEAAHPAGSGRKGRVSFKLTVNDRGHVTLTEIRSSSLPGGSDVEACMVRVLRDLRFPRAAGDSSLSFQMSFGR